ncbi:6557_t:CDS:2, partial [Acaulospora colombiana]
STRNAIWRPLRLVQRYASDRVWEWGLPGSEDVALSPGIRRNLTWVFDTEGGLVKVREARVPKDNLQECRRFEVE